MIRALLLSLCALAFAASPALAIDNDVDILTASPDTYMYYSNNDTVINVFVTVEYDSNHVVGKTLTLRYYDEVFAEWKDLLDGSGEPAVHLLLTNVTNGRSNGQISFTNSDPMYNYIANGGQFTVEATMKNAAGFAVAYDSDAFNNLP